MESNKVTVFGAKHLYFMHLACNRGDVVLFGVVRLLFLVYVITLEILQCCIMENEFLVGSLLSLELRMVYHYPSSNYQRRSGISGSKTSNRKFIRAA
jgi:hypothetical protein